MKFIIPLMLILAVLIVFGAHYLIYKFVTNFFEINNKQTKIILVIVLFVLSVAFIIAAILTRFTGHPLLQTIYFLAGTWYGWLVYLLIATGLGWLIFYIFKIFGLALNLKLTAIILYSLAVVITFYGIGNAFNLQTRNLVVPIKNLPLAWEGKTAVQITDIHLGAIYGVGYLHKIITSINQINPDIIFITGDFFDGTCPHLEEFVKPLDDLHPPLGIYFIYGNHETYEGKDRVAKALEGSRAVLLVDKIVNIEGVNLIGLDYISEGLKRDTTIFNQVDKNAANILLYHQPTLIVDAKKAGISLQLSGHAHSGQIFPINFISRLVYGKYYDGYYQEGDYSIYTSSGTGTWGPPLRTSGQNEITVIKFIKQ